MHGCFNHIMCVCPQMSLQALLYRRLSGTSTYRVKLVINCSSVPCGGPSWPHTYSSVFVFRTHLIISCLLGRSVVNWSLISRPNHSKPVTHACWLLTEIRTSTEAFQTWKLAMKWRRCFGRRLISSPNSTFTLVSSVNTSDGHGFKGLRINAWYMKDILNGRVYWPKKHREIFNISEIFHEIFQAKKFREILRHCA